MIITTRYLEMKNGQVINQDIMILSNSNSMFYFISRLIGNLLKKKEMRGW